MSDAAGGEPDLIRVVLADANVLYSRVLRDYLLYAADQEIVAIAWSSQILAEVTEHLMENVEGFDQAAAQRLIGAMNRAFPYAEMEPDEEHWRALRDLSLPEFNSRASRPITTMWTIAGDEPGWDSRNGLLVPPRFIPEDIGGTSTLQAMATQTLAGSARRLHRPGYPGAHQVRSGLTPDVLLPNAGPLLSARMLTFPGVPATDMRMRGVAPKLGLVPVAARLAGLDSTVYREHFTESVTTGGTALNRQHTAGQAPRLLLGRGYMGDPYQALENSGTGTAGGSITAHASGEDSGATSFGDVKPEEPSALIEYVTRPVLNGSELTGGEIRLVARTSLAEARRILGLDDAAPDAAKADFAALVNDEQDLTAKADAFVAAADAEDAIRYGGPADRPGGEDRERTEDAFWEALQRHYERLDAFRSTYVAIGDDVPDPPRPARVFDNADPPMFDQNHPTMTGSVEPLTVLAYLEGGRVHRAGSERMTDVVNPSLGAVVPTGHRTDGTWVWSESVAYYLRTYGLRPDPDLVDHIMARSRP